MTKKEIEILLKSSFGKEILLFSDYDLIAKNYSNYSLFECPNCSFKGYHGRKYCFKNHYILTCTKLRNLSVKKFYKVRHYNQNPIDFVKDISNFYLNYNILTLYQNSYIRII